MKWYPIGLKFILEKKILLFHVFWIVLSCRCFYIILEINVNYILPCRLFESEKKLIRHVDTDIYRHFQQHRSTIRTALHSYVLLADRVHIQSHTWISGVNSTMGSMIVLTVFPLVIVILLYSTLLYSSRLFFCLFSSPLFPCLLMSYVISPLLLSSLLPSKCLLSPHHLINPTIQPFIQPLGHSSPIPENSFFHSSFLDLRWWSCCVRSMQCWRFYRGHRHRGSFQTACQQICLRFGKIDRLQRKIQNFQHPLKMVNT